MLSSFVLVDSIEYTGCHSRKCLALLSCQNSFEDSELSCSQEKGVYLSAAATVVFFIASCLNCCAPQSDPFCFNFGRENKPATTRTVEKPNRTTIVLQPVIIQTDNNNSNSARKPNSSSKRKNTNTSKQLSEKV